MRTADSWCYRAEEYRRPATPFLARLNRRKRQANCSSDAAHASSEKKTSRVCSGFGTSDGSNRFALHAAKPDGVVTAPVVVSGRSSRGSYRDKRRQTNHHPKLPRALPARDMTTISIYGIKPHGESRDKQSEKTTAPTTTPAGCRGSPSLCRQRRRCWAFASTIAPTIPKRISMRIPSPDLFTILLPIKPAASNFARPREERHCRSP